MLRVVSLTFTFLLIQRTSAYKAFGPAVHQLTEPVEHGEGPTWDGRTGLLYFVDINQGKVLSYDPKNGETFFIKLDGTVTPVVQVKGDSGKFIVGVNRSVVAVSWNGKSDRVDQKVITTVANEFPTSRFNDGKADSRGRLWFGTIGFEDDKGVNPNEGSLFFITKNNINQPKRAIAPVTVSNGLAWNKANNKFYYIDTPTYKIFEYDYDSATGNISNQREVFDFQPLGASALPDGMTIDKDDNLWVALYGGGSVAKIDPRQKKLLRRVAIPAEFVTSVMWGGKDLDVLFVTTSRLKLNQEQRNSQPAAGSLFAVKGLGTSGFPVFEADILQ